MQNREGGLLFVVVSRQWQTTHGVGGGRMTMTAITTAMVRGQQRQHDDGGRGGNGRNIIIVWRPRPAPPSHSGQALPPRVVVIRFAPATSPSAVGHVVLLVLLIIVARRRGTPSNGAVVTYSSLINQLRIFFIKSLIYFTTLHSPISILPTRTPP